MVRDMDMDYKLTLKEKPFMEYGQMIKSKGKGSSIILMDHLIMDTPKTGLGMVMVIIHPLKNHCFTKANGRMVNTMVLEKNYR